MFAWQVKGMNALFGLHLQISVGESLIVGTAVSYLYVLTCNMYGYFALITVIINGKLVLCKGKELEDTRQGYIVNN